MTKVFILQPVTGASALVRRETMIEPDDVAVALRLHELGWGARRIARELGISKNTVKRLLRQGGWRPYKRPKRSRTLDGLEPWLEERFKQHRGNADVVRQELKSEKGIEVSLRTVERRVQRYRAALCAEAQATVRFETPPGKQLQIDYGTVTTEVGGQKCRIKLFVATLGYSRRMYVQAFRHERQSAWLRGIEGAFRHFGGLPEHLLIDNGKALVDRHDAESREVVFNGRFRAFCRYWGVTAKACAPYRARTKGKDERGVGYTKRNAIAGRMFTSWSHLEEHLAWWLREVSDERVHGTTGEVVAQRFKREVDHLRPLEDRPPFEQVRELQRRVQIDCLVDVDTNRYSVPWRLLRAEVTVQVSSGVVRVLHAGRVVAEHAEAVGRYQVVREPRHFAGLSARPAGAVQPVEQGVSGRQDNGPADSELQRPLDVYERATGGAW